jgi:hypothetical protein
MRPLRGRRCFIAPRELSPTAIHVLSLRDNQGTESRDIHVSFALKMLSTKNFAGRKVEPIAVLDCKSPG